MKLVGLSSSLNYPSIVLYQNDECPTHVTDASQSEMKSLITIECNLSHIDSPLKMNWKNNTLQYIP